MSPGEQLIDLVHVDDVVRAFEMAAGRLLEGKVNGEESYGVSSGKSVSLKTLVGILGEILGVRVAVEFGRRPYRVREVMTPWSRGGAVPGWRAEIGLRGGLEGVCVGEGGITFAGPCL